MILNRALINLLSLIMILVVGVLPYYEAGG
jgi:hypothetical protein